MMKDKLLTILAVGLLAGPVAAQAAAPVVDGGGKLTGATGVTVMGESYDVTFQDGSC